MKGDSALSPREEGHFFGKLLAPTSCCPSSMGCPREYVHAFCEKLDLLLSSNVFGNMSGTFVACEKCSEY